ncbi:HTTM domain-containing protein [Cytophagaceae bacterium 50C-KIRBA]|uniref:HTTM domain-containing protein n=1 Tax=Aquirufa beregesia TaxID=2516556 RepID=A0ABX0F0D4_9BACT|nr:HTTM domain-containing protein [Aquirufa beregesia]NGZ44927.1 HTTM domain-containing protein [Aquirufa beregesia]
MMGINQYVKKTTNAAPLAVFRICFGLMLFGSIIRFWNKGWIESLYIKPTYFFTFYGFEWVKPWGEYTYALFFICALSAFMVAIGLFYRVAISSLFLSFSYIELMDKSTYLNHYYFISLICLLLVFLPAQVYFSVDSYRHKQIRAQFIPQWNIDSIKLMMAILYFYAGLAKVNSDWLWHAQPLSIWLPARNDMPIIGFLFNYTWIPYLFSWFGCLYDLSIPFLLWNKKTRIWAYVAVIVFHVLTALLFPIGMFPHIMMVAALIFFSAEFHQNVMNRMVAFFRLPIEKQQPSSVYQAPRFLHWGFVLFFAFQIIFPFRYLIYPDELFWTEEGYRFSWRVMLMEKAGYAQFTVKGGQGQQAVVNNNVHLSTLQEKMMSTQPDMILQYAHYLCDYYAKLGFSSPQVYVDSYVALNGRLGKPLINPQTDLAKEQDSFTHKTWILPFNDTIKGF